MSIRNLDAAHAAFLAHPDIAPHVEALPRIRWALEAALIAAQPVPLPVIREEDVAWMRRIHDRDVNTAKHDTHARILSVLEAVSARKGGGK